MARLLLADVMKRREISKRQLAKRLKIDYSSVFRYFRKGYDPKLSTLEKWAKALGVKIRDLIED